ncbi:hypothetical protein [Mycolicibacterium iranicum]|uniref:hypothetical protein n=1 Tax=Mycolicibacterium iranicum TaxID=912594 RepID=UPI0013A5676E|nr:hypothetical protein [Mycolicibacterium iranicum]
MTWWRVVKEWWALGPLALLAVTAALGMTGALGSVLHWFGEVGAEPFISALSAGGTIAAAVVALRIATTDRRERQEERAAHDRARANLVVIDIDGSSVRDSGNSYISVKVGNHSGRSVLDVSVVEILIDGIASRNHFHSDNVALSVISLNSGQDTFTLRPQSEYMKFVAFGVRTPGDDDIFHHPEKYAPRITAQTSFVAIVEFTDADGNTWQKSSVGELTGPRARSPIKTKRATAKTGAIVELPIETLVKGDFFVPETGNPSLDQPWLISRIDREGNERLGLVRALYKWPDDQAPAVRQREGTLVKCIRKD